MKASELANQFNKRKEERGLEFHLGEPGKLTEINKKEEELNLQFPDQIKFFFQSHNGLKVKSPKLEIFPVQKLTSNKGIIVFAKIDGNQKICFDASFINEANQWNIVHCETNFLITKTMASFWSNKIWAWLDKRKTIWNY